ncbi:MAG: peptide-methionine (R)-S-oxide reductase MsrB [Dehalococcoidia bacterium]|nr:peptide-methionine (R)-S-oxide reductase MsrB [Dehalococcoidia bacterium]
MEATNEAQYREKLTDMQYHVTQEKGTEPPFTGIYWNEKEPGIYRCICCDTPLFSSKTKYDSGTGWPSFWEPLEGAVIKEEEDRSFGMVRTEVMCGTCGAHLGHLFPDGPAPTGLRYCLNSASLRLDTESD